MFPGGRLSGRESPALADFSHLGDGVLALETRPADPYSVNINFTVRDGAVLIDPGEGRRWLAYLRADPRVRVRIGDQVYPMTAVLMGAPGEVEGFPPDRFVYRLEPRR